MKKRIVLSLITVLSIGSFSFVLISKGGKSGYTGSPGENSCTSCHNSYAINSGTGSITFSSDIPGDIYTPSTTYHITFTVRKAGLHLYGFGMEALKTGNANAGTFVVTDATHTQLVTAVNGRKNMVHRLNGGNFPDSAVFTFNWTAPATNVGPITFYYNGVCGNGNNSDNLDYVYKGSHTVTSTSTVGIEGVNQPYADLEVKPFASAQLIEVNFNLTEQADVKLYLLGLDGKMVQSATYNAQEPGLKNYTLHTTGLNSGVYILHAEINGAGVNRKFLLTQ